MPILFVQLVLHSYFQDDSIFCSVSYNLNKQLFQVGQLSLPATTVVLLEQVLIVGTNLNFWISSQMNDLNQEQSCKIILYVLQQVFN
jgi:hypothetical protein